MHEPDIGLPARQVETVAGRQNLLTVPIGKQPQTVRQVDHFAAELGQRIIDPGRNGGKHGSGDEPVAFKLAQGERQRLL